MMGFFGDNTHFVILGALLLFFIASAGVLMILWIALPFSLFGTKRLVRKLIEEQEKTNRLLAAILEEGRKKGKEAPGDLPEGRGPEHP